MHSVEIDFEVFKQLTIRRHTEEVTYNDVIRELLGLEPASKSSAPSDENDENDWIVKGVRFPVNTEFRAVYKGQLQTGKVENGVLVVNGKTYDSPSAAAISITGNSVNGWRFWECKLPGSANWKLIETVRKQ